MKRMSGKFMRHAFLAAGCVLVTVVPAFAEENLQVGSYKGGFEVETPSGARSTGSAMVKLELKIERVERGSVVATLSMSGKQCPGDHPMEGRVDAGKLFLKATRPPAGCAVAPLELAVGAAALEGTYGKRPIQLRR